MVETDNEATTSAHLATMPSNETDQALNVTCN